MAWVVTTGDGIDLLVTNAGEFETEDGQKSLKCICRVRPELRDYLMKIGKLNRGDILSDGSFIKSFPWTSFKPLGEIIAGHSRFLLSVNFDGSPARFDRCLGGMEKDQYIATLERDNKYWKGRCAILYEQALKSDQEFAKKIKDDMKGLEPVKKFVKPYYPYFMGRMGGFPRPMRMGPMGMPEEEEGEELG